MRFFPIQTTEIGFALCARRKKEQQVAEKIAHDVAADNAQWEHEKARHRELEETRRAEHEARLVAAAKVLSAQKKLLSATVEVQRAMNQNASLQRSKPLISQVLRAAWAGNGVVRLSNAQNVTYLVPQVHSPATTVQMALVRCLPFRYQLSMRPQSTIECVARPDRIGQYKRCRTCELSLSNQMSSVDHLI